MSEQNLRLVVASGDRLESLRAIRDNLAANIVAAAPQYVAALSKQLTEVMRELDHLAPREQTSLDQIAAQRQKRRTRTQVSKRAASGKQRGSRGS